MPSFVLSASLVALLHQCNIRVGKSFPGGVKLRLNKVRHEFAEQLACFGYFAEQVKWHVVFLLSANHLKPGRFAFNHRPRLDHVEVVGQ
jgi:hypothetical protein